MALLWTLTMPFSAAHATIQFTSACLLQVVFDTRTFITNDDLDIGDTRELRLNAFGESLKPNQYSSGCKHCTSRDGVIYIELTNGRCHHIGREFHQLKNIVNIQ